MSLAAHSKKDIILDALHRNGMAPDVRTLVVWTKGMDHGMNVKTMTKALWAMQKQQLVGFAERHGELFKIRMTDIAASTFYGREKRRKEPVERVVEAPRKPRIIPTPEYKVPEPPRYASPPPPAQNVKSFTDENTASAARQGKDVVVDTHTQYQPEVKFNIYPDKPKSRAGQISQRVAARFLDGLDKIGGHGSRRAAAAAVGINTNSRPTTIAQAAEHWGWITRSEVEPKNEIWLTDVGREILRQYREDEDPENWELTPDKKKAVRKPRPKMNGVEALEVVARDVADAEPKESTSTGDEMLRNMQLEEQDLSYKKVYDVPNLADYPLIDALMRKEKRVQAYEQAAEILTAADDTANPETGDLVLALLEKIQITDLEREVIRFVREVI